MGTTAAFGWRSRELAVRLKHDVKVSMPGPVGRRAGEPCMSGVSATRPVQNRMQ